MPTTEAGKRLLASNWTSLPMSDDFFDMNEAIAAIEAEARADNAEEIAAGAMLAERARIRAAVDVILQRHVDCFGYCEVWGERDELEAIIDESKPASTKPASTDDANPTASRDPEPERG